MIYKYIGNYRLNNIKSDPSTSLNWIFLPGGPGMGSEYLIDFVTKLKVPGNMIICDFPGDGSNRNVDQINYTLWKDGLLQLVKELQPCILVTHSFSGMFALTVPELENYIKGLVLISSVPNKGWMLELAHSAKHYNLPDVSSSLKEFYKNPIDENLKNIFYVTKEYLFLPHETEEGNVILEATPFNGKSRMWADLNFHSIYEYKWIPKTLPTLIIGSKDDRLLPSKLMEQQKDFHRPNIEFLTLQNAGHFPWISEFKAIEKSIVHFIALQVELA